MKKFLLGLLFALLSSPSIATTICASVPYTFVNGTTANGTQVNANFSTILNCFNTGTANSGANGNITSLSALTSLTNSGNESVGSITNSGDYTSTGTGELALPAGTTGQRSGSPAVGMVRYNTTINQYESYDGQAWGTLGVPVGYVQMTATSSCASGWFANNGQAISRTTYANLFAAIGTTYGSGDGSTTFNVPNDLGYFWRSVNVSNSGVDPNRTLGSTQADVVGPHTHSLAIGGPNSFINSAGSNYTFTQAIPSSTGAVNSGGGSETRPKNIAFTSCIKF